MDLGRLVRISVGGLTIIESDSAFGLDSKIFRRYTQRTLGLGPKNIFGGFDDPIEKISLNDLIGTNALFTESLNELSEKFGSYAIKKPTKKVALSNVLSGYNLLTNNTPSASFLKNVTPDDKSGYLSILDNPLANKPKGKSSYNIGLNLFNGGQPPDETSSEYSYAPSSTLKDFFVNLKIENELQYANMDDSIQDTSSKFGVSTPKVDPFKLKKSYEDISNEYQNKPAEVRVPAFKKLSDNKSRAIARALVGARPYFVDLEIITESTASIAVGIANGDVFKIYDDKEQAHKEATILRKLGQVAELDGRVQKLSKFSPGFEQFFGGEIPDSSGVIEIEGLYVIKTSMEAESSNHDDFADFPDLNSLNADQRLKQSLEKLCSDVPESTRPGLVGSLYDNPIVNRLYTTSLVHSKLKDQFSKDEIKKLKLDGFKSDKDYDEIESRVLRSESNSKYNSIFDSDFKDLYHRISDKQKILFEDRKEKDDLVIIHGDTKWDNWIAGGSVLIDFGSANLSTEYKDIAKALIDFNGVKNQDLVDDYLHLYIGFREQEGNQMHESFSEFRDNVYGAILLESMRAIFYKPTNTPVVEHHMGVIEKYKGILLTP